MVYLEKPNTAIEWVEGANQSKQIRYSAGEMQGWRLNMVSKTHYLLIFNLLILCRKMLTFRT
jgi:hypothetical protein